MALNLARLMGLVQNLYYTPLNLVSFYFETLFNKACLRPMAGAAPIVKMPPSDPTKEIAGTRSEHRYNVDQIYIFDSDLVWRNQIMVIKG